MLEVLDSEYVRFARIKGLSERKVIFKHALKNALIPVLTFGGISFAGLLNGSIVVEVVYAWPGLPYPRRSLRTGSTNSRHVAYRRTGRTSITTRRQDSRFSTIQFRFDLIDQQHFKLITRQRLGNTYTCKSFKRFGYGQGYPWRREINTVTLKLKFQCAD